MNFTRVFRGYSPNEVDKYIEDLEKKETSLRATMQQRINELADENYSLRKQVEQYRIDEQAISKSLIDSQKLALELQSNAEKFSELILSRAKIFYATWHTYAKTLIATLSDEEVRRFNELQKKLEKIINAYDGGDVRHLAQEVENKSTTATAETTNPVEETANTLPSETTMGVGENPITKVERAAGVIDLQEILFPHESLEELCLGLGLTPGGKK